MQGKKQWEKEFKARIHSPNVPVAIGFSKPHLQNGLTTMFWLCLIIPKIVSWEEECQPTEEKDRMILGLHPLALHSGRANLNVILSRYCSSSRIAAHATQGSPRVNYLSTSSAFYWEVLFPTLTVRTKIAKTVASIPKIEVPIIILLRFWKSEHCESSPSIYTCD